MAFPSSSSKSLLLESTPEAAPEITDMIDETVHLANGELSLSQKLVKALILVLGGLHRDVVDRETRPSASRLNLNEAIFPGWTAAPTTRTDAPPPPPPAPESASPAGLTPAQYSDLLEVLASALRDASSAPWLWSSDSIGQLSSMAPPPQLPQDITSLHDLMMPSGFSSADLCDPLGLPPPGVMPDVPPSTLSVPTPETAATPAEVIVVRDLPSLLFDNLTDLVSLLKPVPMPSPTFSPASLSPSDIVTAPSSPRPPSPFLLAKPSKPPINKLPSEMLSRVLAMARRRRDETACECEHACISSRGATQRWALTLLLVCKSWKSAATFAAYSSIRLRRRAQIGGLVKLVRQRPELSDIIADIDIKVPGMTSPVGQGGAGGPGGHPYLGHPRHGSRRAAAFPWLSPTEKRLSPAQDADDQLVASLIDLCPALAKLELNVAKPGFSYASWAYGADFLEQGLERALGAAPSLRALTLRACIDFCELEAVLMSCSTIEVLRLEGGVDNLDGTDDALTDPHQCKLKELFINSWESTDLGEAQLCWLLASSVGTLERLEVATSVGLTAAGLGAIGQAFPAFSGFAFAELLVELAPTLTRLALKDSLGAGPGMGQGNPSLRQPPFDGHFDYALARCHRLRELALEWSYVGPAFLNSMQSKPVEALALLGAPNVHTNAKDLAKALTTSFPDLDRLALAHFPLHQVAQGWTARDLRTLRKASQERNLQFEFTTI